MASIEKRTDKKGKVSYRVKVRMRGRNLSETFKRLTDARTWATQTEAAIQEQRLAGAQARKHTVSDLIDRYVENELSEIKTAEFKHRHLKWWKSEIGGYKLADVTPALVTECRDKLKKGRAAGTVNRYLVSLSSVFAIAIREWGWLENNPVSRVKKMKEPRGRVRFLSDDKRDNRGVIIEGERTRLLKACKESRSPNLYPIVVLALSTGMRRGEILGLTWDRVDLKHGRLTITDTKNGEIRAIPVTGAALDLLKERAKKKKKKINLVFPDRSGKAPAKFRDSWLSALERAEIEDFRFHDLRHTAASYLAMSGATLAEIAEILGHKTLQMVKRYSHFSTDHVSGVISKLNDRMFGDA
jgi:integrase